MKLLLVPIVLLVCITASHPINRIINGKDEYDAIPYVVSVQTNGQHVCGGFIHSKTWVITAASCVYNLLVSSLKISINDLSFLDDNEPFEEKVSVYQVFINEGFNNVDKFNDIALLELSSPLNLVPLESYVNSGNNVSGPSCIRYDEFSLADYYSQSFMPGWGSNSTEDVSSSTSLHTAWVDITNSEYCAEVLNFSSQTMICAANTKAPIGDPGITVPCTYDEGSPLVAYARSRFEYVAVGIFSYNNNCEENSPSIFTRLSVFYGWISRIAGYQSECYFS